MKTSIATVSISGDFVEKLVGHRGRAASTASRSSRTISSPSTARRATSAAWCGTPASTITLFQPFRDFEGLPEPQRARAFDRAERKFDVMQELGTDLMLICSNVSPICARRHRPRGGGFPRTRRTRRQARPARRLRGAGLGPAHQRPSRRLGDRAPRRSSECRTDPRLLPHAGAQDRRRLDPVDPARQDLHRAARRCAADRHGLSLLEPALPQHAGPGRPAGEGLHARGRRDRL